MLAIESDLERGISGILVAPPAEDDDWLAYADAIDALNRDAPSTTRPVLLQLIHAGTPMPSALVRKRLVELRGRIRSDAVNLVVSDSKMLRATQVALDWVRKPHYDSSSHADLESALAHAERALGKPMPGLRVIGERLLSRLGA